MCAIIALRDISVTGLHVLLKEYALLITAAVIHWLLVATIHVSIVLPLSVVT